MDDRLVLYKIYGGMPGVASTKDFGTFVKLEGIAGRIEGTSNPLFSKASKYSDLLLQGCFMSRIFDKDSGAVQISLPIPLAAANSSRPQGQSDERRQPAYL
jgi:hypothetical protein